MDHSLQALCSNIKKIIQQLKPQQQPLSFLLLMGRDNQGKKTLLNQSGFEHLNVQAEKPVDIYFNKHGLIVELSESWLNQNKNLLQFTLKQINRCHPTLKLAVCYCVLI